MSSHSQITFLTAWCAHPVLLSVVAGLMWRRRLHRQFPIFFSYVLWQITVFVVTFPLWLKNNYEWFFWAYWVGEAVSAVLGFKTIHEVFLDVFRPYHSLKDLGTIVFRWAGAVMLMVSAVVAFSNSPNYTPIVHAVTTLQRSVRFVQFGLVAFLILFSRFLGVSRRQQSFGIALGFGFFASFDLVLLALNSGGLVHKESFSFLIMIAFNLSILIWAGYGLVPDPAARTVPANHFQTERWEESLTDLQHPAAGDSLIPMFEGMVERALSRTSTAPSATLPENVVRAPGTAAPPKSIPAAAGAGGRTSS